MATATGYARNRAALVIRCLAALVDLLSLLLAAFVTQQLGGYLAARLGLRITSPVEAIMLIGVALLVSGLEVIGDASSGKLLCGLRIRSVTGLRAPMHRRLARWAMKTIPLSLALVAACLEQLAASRGGRSDRLAERIAAAAMFSTVGVFIAFAPAGSRSRQTLYDMIARTVVGSAKPEHLDYHRGFEPVMTGEKRFCD
ncbi:hypothetical protein BH09PLA1_BH09PLA1_27550 [soil metagenome]